LVSNRPIWLVEAAFVDLHELLGSEDPAPLAEVDQLQLVPRRGLRHAAPSCPLEHRLDQRGGFLVGRRAAVDHQRYRVAMGGRRVGENCLGFGAVDDLVLGERHQHGFTNGKRRVSCRT
jgi:hypothetical protein